MPATQFFVMIESQRQLYSRELIHNAYIARAAQTSDQGFKDLIGFFQVNGQEYIQEQAAPQEESVLKAKPFKASSEEAKNRLMHLFASDKRISRKRIEVH